MNKLRILILIDVFEDINGGAERQVYEFIKGIDKSRFEIYLSILHQNNIPDEMSGAGCRVSGVGINKIYNIKGIIAGFKFAKFLKKEKIDILLTYHFASDIWGTIFGKIAGVRSIISSRRDIGFWRNKNHVRAYKFINRWVSKIVVVSEAVWQMVIDEEGVAVEKVMVIHNGVDISRFTSHKVTRSQGRLKLGLSEDEKVIISVGNFNSVTKGQAVLIEAMAIVAKKNQNVRLLLIGDGLLKESLLSLVVSLQLKNKIIFLGKGEDVSEILSVVDVCVLPSLSEGLSNALLEYMAAGRPVVATSVGGNIDVIKNGLNGLLVPSEDPTALANAIIKLFDEPDLANRLGCEARITVENDFEVGKQIGKLMEFIVNECTSSY